jgi:hypothetical protein
MDGVSESQSSSTSSSSSSSPLAWRPAAVMQVRQTSATAPAAAFLPKGGGSVLHLQCSCNDGPFSNLYMLRLSLCLRPCRRAVCVCVSTSTPLRPSFSAQLPQWTGQRCTRTRQGRCSW